jgi:hypothetical protein
LAEAISGFAVFFLALWIWWRMFLWPPTYGLKFDADEAWFIVMMVGPGLCVAVGAYLQAACRWFWPTALVLVASAGAAYMGLVAWLLFGYTGHKSSLPVVYLYLILILLTVVFSLMNAFAEQVLRFSKRRADQINQPRSSDMQ